MIRDLSPFNVLAAAGICASLALLGWEIEAAKSGVQHYSMSIAVAPDNAERAPFFGPDHGTGGLDNHDWRSDGQRAPNDGQGNDGGDAITTPDADDTIDI